MNHLLWLQKCLSKKITCPWVPFLQTTLHSVLLAQSRHSFHQEKGEKQTKKPVTLSSGAELNEGLNESPALTSGW